jgi:hypothetical protein
LTNYCSEFLKIVPDVGILERVRNFKRLVTAMEGDSCSLGGGGGDSRSLGGVSYSSVPNGLLVAKVTPCSGSPRLPVARNVY